MYEVIGSVERVIFTNDKNGYSVIEITSEEANITATGIMPGISVGEELQLIGEFKSHPVFGEQLNVKTYKRSLPSTVTSILKYLSSGAVKGVGSSTALKLVNAFGDKTLEVIEKTPERLSEVKGLSKAKATKIAEEFKQLFGVKMLMTELGKYGIAPEETVRIFKAFGTEAMDSISANPYILCDEPINIS
ncbi:MAG: ATP-dependent RecD-like DNA helicase, partial [Clostridia bacterium]|nr:ATP-dependent RecD-like DNA helicase [Clostridia bacterium]